MKTRSLERNLFWPTLGGVFLLLGGAASSPPAGPIVVELFTSQGCSSCPPANAAVAALADRPDVLALSFGVTYWDRLGWKDTFASSQYTQRQWDYARGLKHDQVWTPQVVVDGRADTPGQKIGLIEPLIAAAKRRRSTAPSIRIEAGEVVVGSAPLAAPATVWLVRYDPRTIQVPIRAGENGGKSLPHRNVVRALVKLGEWRGEQARLSIGLGKDPALRQAVLVQAGVGGPILTAARL